MSRSHKSIIGVVRKSLRGIGGIESVTANLVEFALMEEHHVVSLTSDHPPKRLVDLGLEPVVEPKIGITIETVAKYVRQGTLTGALVEAVASTLRPAVESFVERVSSSEKGVIFYPNFSRLYALPLTSVLVDLCGLREIPIVAREGGYLAGPWERAMLAVAHRIIVPCRPCKSDYVSNGVKAGKVVVVRNGIPGRFFDGGDRVDKARRPTILFPGRMASQYTGINWKKGIEDCLIALPMIARDFPSVQLVFAGNDPTIGRRVAQAKRAIINKARALGVAGHVKFLPAERCHYSEIHRAYASASIVLCPPRHREPYCNVVWEGMASHKPVVTTRLVGSIKEVSHAEDVLRSKSNLSAHQPFVLTPPERPDLIAHVIRGLLRHPELGQRIGHNGRKLAKQRSISRFAMLILQVLDDARYTPLALSSLADKILLLWQQHRARDTARLTAKRTFSLDFRYAGGTG
jgi:glycosyltransferase involved in cell wall biosynthesis